MAANADSRLSMHAGLADPAGEPPSLADTLAASPFSPEDLKLAVEDVLDALSQFNRELNGSVPSRTVGRGSDIPRSTTYSVLEISRLLRNCEGKHPSVADAAWSVDAAWLAVVAGDIDNLRKHLDEEHVTQAMRCHSPQTPGSMSGE